MPPRGSRKRTSDAVSAEISSPGNQKRKVDQKADPASPVRRSKRVKSTEELRDTGADTGAIANKAEIEETEVSIEAASNGAGIKPEEADETPVTKTKATKRKTKKEKEADLMPLRVRTQGLRMCVGAHVSAAKGSTHCTSLAL